jgi:hypothetical protein
MANFCFDGVRMTRPAPKNPRGPNKPRPDVRPVILASFDRHVKVQTPEAVQRWLTKCPAGTFRVLATHMGVTHKTLRSLAFGFAFLGVTMDQYNFTKFQIAMARLREEVSK